MVSCNSLDRLKVPYQELEKGRQLGGVLRIVHIMRCNSLNDIKATEVSLLVLSHSFK